MGNHCANSEVEIEKLKIQSKGLAIHGINTKAKILKNEHDLIMAMFLI